MQAIRTFVVTGANRAIELEWVRQLLVRPGNRVLAGVSGQNESQDVQKMVPGIEVLPLEAGDAGSLNAWADEVAKKTPHIDGEMSIANKTIVLTGANRGIGLEWARQLLARPGNRIIAGVRQPDKAADLKALGGSRVQILPLDVSSSTSIESWADEIKASTPHVDVVINNAGVYGERQDLGSVTSENMVSTFVANTVGPLLIVQALASRGLLGGSAGPTLVATVSSKMGSVEDTSTGSYAYRASKAGVNIVCKALANELGPKGVTVTLLHPGYVITDMTEGRGLIDTATSVGGMLSVLEGGDDIHGKFLAWDKKVVPW